MTDARLPERWLNDRRLARLSDAAFRLYVTALMWAVANRTEGLLAADDLPLMPRVDLGRVDELEKAGLWTRDQDGWLIAEFVETQTSNEQLAATARARLLARDRKARQRAREREEKNASSRDVTRDYTGQDRPGQDRPGQDRPRQEELSARVEDNGAACVSCGQPVEEVRRAGGWPECGKCHAAGDWPQVRELPA